MNDASGTPGNTETKTADGTQADQFPVADVQKINKTGILGLLRRSSFWWLTLLCVVVAGYLTWSSMGSAGPKIVIHFDEGHGIKVGNVMRHRGIDVGQITAVNLNADLSGIDVTVMLSRAAAGLAREGSRFWIVRPKLSLTEVSGLETAIGAKYIGVDPGEPGGTKKREFDGLPSAPPDGLEHSGIEVVLRGDRRHGLSVGSPVMYRGIDVGTILAVQLSQDANAVDIRVRIDGAYQMLLRDSSRFWKVSGINVDVGLTGLEFSADSLSSIARGGVSFITPASDSDAPVKTGHVFELFQKPEDEWIEQAARISLMDVPLHVATVGLQATWQQKRFGFTSDKNRSGHGVVVGSSGGPVALAPMDLVTPPASAVAGSFRLDVSNESGQQLKAFESELEAVSEGTDNDPIGVHKLPVQSVAATRRDQLRVPDGIEAVFVVPNPSSAFMLTIGDHQIEAGENSWQIKTSDPIAESWHGAPIVAAKDGKVIGLLIVHGDVATIVPLNAKLLAGFE